MDLYDYFESTKGTGVLATADKDGRVDAALYSRPHVMEDGTIAFIMRDRLSHANVASNPQAAYLFVEDGPGYKGKRLFLKMVREEKETELLYKLRRRTYPSDANPEKDPKYLVFFELERVLPLVGSDETSMEG
jgi:hypothetical protein